VTSYAQFAHFSHPSNPLDSSIFVLLRQQQTHLLHLKSRWANILTSSIRFDAHITTAQEVVCAFSQANDNVPTYILPPLSPPTYNEPPESDDEQDSESVDDAVVDNNSIVLNDILLDQCEDDDQADDDPVYDKRLFNVQLLWSVPVSDFVTLEIH
jgi:hypothetical protein